MDEFCGNCGAKIDLSISDVCPNCGTKIGAAKFKTMKSIEEIIYAGFWLRFFAYIIDGLILLIPFMVCLGIAGGDTALQYVLAWFVGLFYFAYLESSPRKATFGKQALGLIVTNLEGEQLTFQQAVIRYVCKLISVFILYIGFIMIGFTEKKQGLHDMIAQTLVIKKL